MIKFAFGLISVDPRHFGKIRSVMLILQFVNVGNSKTDARDSIVVLTCMRGSLLLHMHQRFPTTYKLERGIVGSRFFLYHIQAFRNMKEISYSAIADHIFSLTAEKDDLRLMDNYVPFHLYSNKRMLLANVWLRLMPVKNIY